MTEIATKHAPKSNPDFLPNNDAKWSYWTGMHVVLHCAMRKAVSVWMCVCFWISSVIAIQAALVWRPGEGWKDEAGGDVSASSSKDQLQLAKRLEEKGDMDEAYKLYKGLVRKWPLSFSAPQAQYKAARIDLEKGDYWKSFEGLRRLVEKYPNSSYFDQAQEYSFLIGDLFLEGKSPKLFTTIPQPVQLARSIIIFETVMKASPYGKWAPQAMLKKGLAKEKLKQFQEAVNIYKELLDKYPGHDIVEDAQYQVGMAWLTASLQPGYNNTIYLGPAESAFEDFVELYPTSKKADQAREILRSLQCYRDNLKDQSAARIKANARNNRATTLILVAGMILMAASQEWRRLA